jgi:hypothetical protein
VLGSVEVPSADHQNNKADVASSKPVNGSQATTCPC